MKQFVYSFFALTLASIIGCTTPSVKHPTVSSIAGSPLLPADILEKKIQYIIDLQEQKQLSEEDREIASQLLESYRLLQEMSSNIPTKNDYHMSVQSLYAALSAIDQRYFSWVQGKDRAYWKPLSLYSTEKDRISDLYLSQDFKGVISYCLQLRKDFGPDALTPEVALVFALALANEGMTEEAIKIGEDIVHALETSPDLIQFMVHIAEWHLSLGQREAALDIYEKLTDKLDRRMAFVDGLKYKISEAEKGPVVIEHTPTIKLPAEKQPHPELESLIEVLRQVDTLIEQRAYDDARLLLIRYGIRVDEGPEMETISQALEDVELAKEKYEKEAISREVTAKKARDLIESEHFEEAIAEIDTLQQTQEVGAALEALKEQAKEDYINHERYRAAKLFSKAEKVQDPYKKREYLLSAKEILDSLISEYHSSPLHEKLVSYLEIVTEALDELQGFVE